MNTPDEMIACIQAHKDGKKLQYYYGEKWYDVFGSPTFNFAAHPYRIKLEPTLRPWKPEEVPVGALIRRKFRPEVETVISGVSITGHFPRILVNNHNFEAPTKLYLGDLLTYHGGHNGDRMEHSLDYGETWLPCGVLSE